MEELPERKRGGFIRVCCPSWFIQGIPLVFAVLVLIALFGAGVLLAFYLTNTTFALLAQRTPDMAVWRETTKSYLSRLTKAETEFGAGDSIVLNVAFPIRTYVPSLVSMGVSTDEASRLTYRPILVDAGAIKLLTEMDRTSLVDLAKTVVRSAAFESGRLAREFRRSASPLLLSLNHQRLIWPTETQYVSSDREGFGLRWNEVGNFAERNFRSASPKKDIYAEAGWSGVASNSDGSSNSPAVGFAVRDLNLEIPCTATNVDLSHFVSQTLTAKLDICGLQRISLASCGGFWDHVLKKAGDPRAKDHEAVVSSEEIEKTVETLLVELAGDVSVGIELDEKTRIIENPLLIPGLRLPKGVSPEVTMKIYQEINIEHDTTFYSVKEF